MKNYIILFSLFFIYSCGQNSDTIIEKTEQEEQLIIEDNTNHTAKNGLTDELIIESENEYTTKTVFSLEHGWGYQILNHGKLYINQPHIPSVQGNNGFKTEENANITANFIIHKLNNNIFPPTISKEELDSLGVL